MSDKKQTAPKKSPGKTVGHKPGIPKKEAAKRTPTSKMTSDARTTAIKIALQTETIGTSVTLKQIRSGAGRSVKQNATLAGLGLGKIGRISTLQDTTAVRGMITKVAHLVDVTESI